MKIKIPICWYEVLRISHGLTRENADRRMKVKKRIRAYLRKSAANIK